MGRRRDFPTWIARAVDGVCEAAGVGSTLIANWRDVEDFDLGCQNSGSRSRTRSRTGDGSGWRIAETVAGQEGGKPLAGAG